MERLIITTIDNTKRISPHNRWRLNSILIIMLQYFNPLSITLYNILQHFKPSSITLSYGRPLWSFPKMTFCIEMNLLCAATCFKRPLFLCRRVAAHSRFYCRAKFFTHLKFTHFKWAKINYVHTIYMSLLLIFFSFLSHILVIEGQTL